MKNKNIIVEKYTKKTDVIIAECRVDVYMQ